MRCVLSTFALFVAGCGALVAAAHDHAERYEEMVLVRGRVIGHDGARGAVVVAALDLHRGELVRVHTYVRLASAGPFSLRVARGDYVIAAFRDVNGDLVFDRDEPAVVYDDWHPITAEPGAGTELELELSGPLPFGPYDVETPSHLIHSGDVVPLDDPRFSAEVGELGEWQPYRFLREHGAGIFLLAPHDPSRIPVLFVHGMGGHPQEFASVIARLDPTRYEAWVAQYPSGWSLVEVSTYLYRELAFVATRFELERLCIEAHSMGGVVARAALGLYAADRTRDRDYVVHFLTLASPLGGHPGAATGVMLSPVVLPAWRDLTPRSGFITELYEPPLPSSVHYDLVYAFDHGDGDGVVPIRSQLRDEAQREAATQRGFDLGHTELLTDEASLDHWIERLEASCR